MTHKLGDLADAELTVDGRMASASNATLHCTYVDAEGALRECIYKPVAGERPLWDFPTGTLAHREIAMYALSSALGWDLVPPTVWREDGPAGPGMCQSWISDADDNAVVDVVPRGQVPQGWRRILDAQDHAGSDVSLVHADSLSLRRMAVLDALGNNADRKGGHILMDPEQRVWAIDHGVTFSPEPKLRTVLWGWSDEPIDESIVRDVSALQTLLTEDFDAIDMWLEPDERWMLRRRVDDILATKRFPLAQDEWPSIPWPVF